MEVQLSRFLTSVVNVNGPPRNLSALALGKQPHSTRWIQASMGPTARVDILETERCLTPAVIWTPDHVA
jgi:hypothetical protein